MGFWARLAARFMPLKELAAIQTTIEEIAYKQSAMVEQLARLNQDLREKESPRSKVAMEIQKLRRLLVEIGLYPTLELLDDWKRKDDPDTFCEKLLAVFSHAPLDDFAPIARRFQDEAKQLMPKLAALEGFSLDVIQEINNQLVEHLDKRDLYGGRDRAMLLADYLSVIPDEQREEAMGAIEDEFGASDPEFVRDIRNMVLTFDDLSRMESSSMRIFLENINHQELTWALAGASPEIKSLVYENLPEATAALVDQNVKAIESRPQQDMIEASRDRILIIFKDLFYGGQVALNGAAEPETPAPTPKTRFMH